MFTWGACHTIRISSVELITGADSSVVGGSAGSMLGTGARIHTDLPLTLLCGGTVWVHQALVGQTLDVGVALVLGEAVADCPVGVDPALCIASAGIIHSAGILAFSADVGQCQGTFRVPLAAS